MRRNMKYISIVIVGLMVIGILTFVKTFGQENSGFNDNVALGDQAYEKKIYIDAIEYYKEASSYKPGDIDTRIKLANSYLKLGNTSEYENTLLDTISEYPSEKAYIELVDYYVYLNDYENAYKILLRAHEQGEYKEVEKRIKEYSGYYDVVGNAYTDVRQWKDGYLAVNVNGVWGLLDQTGDEQIEIAYKTIGNYSDDENVTAVFDGDEYYYINEEGYRKLVGDHAYTYLGDFNDGLAPASYNNKWGWINRDFEEYHFEYDYITPFLNDVCAVKKGNKWALMDSDLDLITDFIYDDVKLDANGYCSHAEAIFVKQDNYYLLVDEDGKTITDEKFDDAKAFNSDQYAAVMKNGKWGFIDADGEVVIDYQYDDAQSFSNGVAGVKNNVAWGIIQQDNSKVIDYIFQDVRAMNEDGIIPVRNADSWQCIQLYAFMQYE